MSGEIDLADQFYFQIILETGMFPAQFTQHLPQCRWVAVVIQRTGMCKRELVVQRDQSCMFKILRVVSIGNYSRLDPSEILEIFCPALTDRHDLAGAPQYFRFQYVVLP